MYIKNSKGEPSLTATAFIIGFIVCNLKLIMSGVQIGSISLGSFSGLEYAAALGALGAVYVLNKKPRGKE